MSYAGILAGFKSWNVPFKYSLDKLDEFFCLFYQEDGEECCILIWTGSRTESALTEKTSERKVLKVPGEFLGGLGGRKSIPVKAVWADCADYEVVDISECKHLIELHLGDGGTKRLISAGADNLEQYCGYSPTLRSYDFSQNSNLRELHCSIANNNPSGFLVFPELLAFDAYWYVELGDEEVIHFDFSGCPNLRFLDLRVSPDNGELARILPKRKIKIDLTGTLELRYFQLVYDRDCFELIEPDFSGLEKLESLSIIDDDELTKKWQEKLDCK